MRGTGVPEGNGHVTVKQQQQHLPSLVVGAGHELEVASKEEAEEQPLSPSARLFHQPRFNCYVIAIMGSSRTVDVDLIKAGIEATLVRHPRFSSLQVLNKEGRECKGRWVRTKVVVEDHLVVPDLSAVDIRSPDKLVEDYISNLSTTTLDFSKPLWDLHVLNVKTSEAEATGILRVHHSLGDGMSLMSLLLACFRKASDPDALPTLPEAPIPRGRGWKERSRMGMMWAMLVWFCTMVRVFWNTMVDVVMFMATFGWLKDSETPIKGREGVEHNKKRFVRKTVNFEDIKTVKCHLNATVNDVLLGMTFAGLTCYLSRRYARDGKNANGDIPENLCVRSTIFVNIRKAPGLHVLADMMQGMETNAPWGNWIGYVTIPFPIIHHGNPLDYVRTAINIANRKKASYEALFTFWVAKAVLKLFGMKKAASLSSNVFSNTTLSLSNVIGPLEEVLFFGHRLVYLAPSIYGHPHALTIHFQSYMGKMEIVLAVDETVIPDPHQLCEDVVESLNLMKNAVASCTASKA